MVLAIAGRAAFGVGSNTGTIRAAQAATARSPAFSQTTAVIPNRPIARPDSTFQE
jgi:hypothetical protein